MFNSKYKAIGKGVLTVFLFLAVLVSGFGQTFQDRIKGFVKDQNNIQSFIGRGTILVEIMSADKVIQRLPSELTLYMKQPDLFKMVVSSGGSSSVTVQKGDLVSQKMDGMDTVITRKVDAQSNLAANYFFKNFDEMYANVQILGSEEYVVDGKRFFKYSIKNDTTMNNPSNGAGEIKIDYTVIHFNDKGRYVKSEIFSGNKVIVSTELSYTDKDGIPVISKMIVVSSVGGMVMVSTIKYDAITINTKISDKEFEIK